MKNPRSGQQISSLDPLLTFRESTTKKVFISQIICLTLFLLCQEVLFLCERQLISFILNCYPLSNFLHLKVICHLNLNRVNFEYLMISSSVYFV